MTSKEDEVLIIGGGIIGVCAAYFLARVGVRVTLVEQGEIGSGSSYGNAGLLVPSHSLPLAAPGVLAQGLKWMLDPESPFYIKPRLDFELMAWLWRFRSYCKEEPMRRAIPLFRDMQRTSLRLYQDLVAEERLDCHFVQGGVLKIFKSQQTYQHNQQETELLQAYGLQIDCLDGATLREMEPALQPDIVGGFYYQEDGHLDPALFVRGLAERAAGYGATLCPATEVVGFEMSGRRITTVHTSQGDYQPEQVVLAAGAWSSQLIRNLPLKLPMQPAKGYSITIKRPDNLIHIPLFLGESRAVVTPLGPHLRFAGTLELAGFAPTINQRRVEAILRAARAYLSGLEEMEVIEIWQGLRPCPPDGLPYLGRSQALSNLIIATGHSFVGVSMGPVTGQVVTQLVTGERPVIELAAMQPERFG